MVTYISHNLAEFFQASLYYEMKGFNWARGQERPAKARRVRDVGPTSQEVRYVGLDRLKRNG